MFKNMSLSWTHPKDLAKFLSKTIVKQIIDLVLQRKKYHIVYREKKKFGQLWKMEMVQSPSSQVSLHWYPWETARLTSVRQMTPSALIFCPNFKHKNLPCQGCAEKNSCPIKSKSLGHFPPINQDVVIKLLILKTNVLGIFEPLLLYNPSTVPVLFP